MIVWECGGFSEGCAEEGGRGGGNLASHRGSRQTQEKTARRNVESFQDEKQTNDSYRGLIFWYCSFIIRVCRQTMAWIFKSPVILFTLEMMILFFCAINYEFWKKSS